MKLEWFDRPRRGERAVAERSRPGGKKQWAYWTTGEESTGQDTGHQARPRAQGSAPGEARLMSTRRDVPIEQRRDRARKVQRRRAHALKIARRERDRCARNLEGAVHPSSKPYHPSHSVKSTLRREDSVDDD